MGGIAFSENATAQAPIGHPVREIESEAFSAKNIGAVVDTVASRLEQLYVDADTAKLSAGKLRARLRAGAYATHPTAIGWPS